MLGLVNTTVYAFQSFSSDALLSADSLPNLVSADHTGCGDSTTVDASENCCVAGLQHCFSSAFVPESRSVPYSGFDSIFFNVFDDDFSALFSELDSPPPRT